MENTVFNPAQQHILQIMSYVKTPEVLANIEKLLADYFSEQIDDEMDKLWDEGKIDSGIIDSWLNEHMRTPYKK